VKKSTAFTVTHFHFQRWPEHGCPPSTSSLLVLMDTVMMVEMGARGKAITVMCRCAHDEASQNVFVDVEYSITRTQYGVLVSSK